MPSAQASSYMDRSRITPASTPTPAVTPGPNSPVADVSQQMSPFFHAALPSRAATYDSLSRQYYRNDAVPTTRLLPASGGLD